MLCIMRNKIILEYNEILLKVNKKIILFIFFCIVVKLCLVNCSVFFYMYVLFGWVICSFVGSFGKNRDKIYRFLYDFNGKFWLIWIKKCWNGIS